MARVVLDRLTKTYPEKSGPGVRAVKGVNLIIEDGEFMVLVGPSGCGKSTILRMIAGLEEISAGAITIAGKQMNHVLPKDRDIAMVFQNYALYPHMSVYENMAFCLKLRKLPKAEIDARVRETAVLLGLDALLDRKPKALSGGQRQRVAVGRAIVRKPKVFLFDEPLSNLDAKMRVTMRTEISKLHAQLGATMVYVTHDQVEAMTMGDRICILNDGDIQQVDEPLTLYEHPANHFVASFIGSPPMNFFRGTVRRRGDRLTFIEDDGAQGGSLGAPIDVELPSPFELTAAPYIEKPVWLGVRPEHILESPDRSVDIAARFMAEIELVEPLGAETFVHLKTGRTSLVARLPATRALRMGQTEQFAFPSAAIRLFDSTTGNAISPL